MSRSQAEDPFRFLTRKKRKDSRKNTLRSTSRQKNTESKNQFVLPSFSSQTSIQMAPKNEYNPAKYFSQSIENYLNSVKEKKSQKDHIEINFQKKMHKQIGEKPQQVEIQQQVQELDDQFNENVNIVQQLKECEICGRKFNLKSYEKHVKVCEKVFFQKRKPFQSRSVSKERKK